MKNNTLFKITDEVAQRMHKLFQSEDFKSFMTTMKANTTADNGTFRMVISTNDVDRHGEIVVQEGLDTTRYMTNPVVLWGHDSSAIPVGITDTIIRETRGTRVSTIAEGRFAEHAFAQTLRKLYDAGMLKTSSIGFIPSEYEGNKITKAELLEWSFVSIPANPFALDAAKTLGLDVVELFTKGFLKQAEGEEVKTEEETTTEETVEEPGEVVDVTNTEEKGAIADEITEMDMNKLKWDKFSKVDKIYWAFMDVYFCEETPVEAFDSLLNEFITLIQGNTVATPTIIVSDNSFETAKAKYFETEIKAGAVLSKANKQKILDAKVALEEVIALAENVSENDVDVPADTNVEIVEEVEEAGEFLKLRGALQGIAKNMQDVLTDAKNVAREKGHKVR